MRLLSTLQSATASIVVVSMLACVTAQAQAPTTPAPSMTPEADARSLLINAKRVAVIDKGADSRWPAQDVNAVQLFKQDLLRWGRYQLVADPASADVVLEIYGSTSLDTIDPGGDPDPGPYTVVDPYLKLSIRDPHAVEPLWTITVPALAGRSHREDLFAMSVRNAVSQIKLLDGIPLTTQEAKDVNFLKTAHRHSVIFWTGLTTVLVGSAIGGAIIMKDKFDHAKTQDEEQQHQFCVQHNIPGC